MRRALVLVLAVILVLAALVVGGARWLRSGPELASDTLALPGLREPVEILYDSMGVPHLFATSMEDLFRAQGYVHATHRLWQMEMFRRVLQGRLSEIFGSRMLETDRFLRTLGLEEAAEASLPTPESPMARAMDSYAGGVNAALESWEDPLPPEFLLLRFRPESWQPLHSQGIGKIMAWDLADYQIGLNLAASRETLGDSAFLPLMPRYPEWGVTILEGWPEEGTGRGTDSASGLPAAAVARIRAGSLPPVEPWNRASSPPLLASRSSPPQLPPAVSTTLLARATLSRDVATILELGSVVRASNGWVVGGERSHSGKPLVANDMHLGLEAPNIWYLVGLHAPGYDVVGMSIPGAPGVVAGHSNAVAWGFTNAMVDDVDFFVERVNSDNPAEYRTPEGWAPFQVREEHIGVRGGDTVSHTVRSTRHGPVITPVEERAGERVLAFRWVAHEPDRTFRALLGMGRARNVDEFLQALRDFDIPHQNVVFADTAGAWGYWMSGRVPLRASGRPPHLPVPGWTGEHDWTGWLPFDEKPHVLAPDRGYVATANNAQGRGDAVRAVSNGHWAPPYRAQRISELLEARPHHDAGSLLAIQMHTGSAFVNRHRSHAVDAFRGAGLEDLARRLEEWDGLADLESREATLFHTWWRTLHRSLMRHYYDGDGGYFPDRMLTEALETGAGLPPELPVEAARTAAEYADLSWGEAHRLHLGHPLRAIPVVGRLLRFGRMDIPREGGPYSVNVAGFGGSRPPFGVGWGPSQRHVVDMADPDGSGGFILPGGQSGYPDNPYSFDQLELWQEGRLWLLPLERGRVEARTVATLRLEPEGG